MTEPDRTDAEQARAVSTAEFIPLLRDALAARTVDGRPLAVMLIDCGIIGRIDSVWGYHVGDAVRQRLSGLLRSEVLRPGDFLGELGRDEFACVLATVEGPTVALLAANKSLRTLNAPFWVGEEEIFPIPAIGFAIHPTHAVEAEGLLQQARSACSQARGLPGRVAEYDIDSDVSAGERLLLENRLRTAINDNALDLLFQPQYDLRLGQIMGAEALLCWPDPSQGQVEAESAFAAAEIADQVSELASSILNRALRNVSEFRYSGGLDLRVCVRLPAGALRHPELVDVVQRSLGTWSRRPGTLMLGISQTTILLSDPTAQETLVRIREIGVKLAVDDPLMRIASLFRLAELPFQEIRFDVSAAADPETSPKSEKILRAIIELAHQLRLGVLAVGVAGESAASHLKALGCDYMQAEFKGPAATPKAFVERYGFSED